MHPYSTDSNERTNVILLISALAIAGALGFNGLIQKMDWSVPWYFESPSPLLLFGLLYFLFDRFLWKWRIFKWMGLVNVPNLNGVWHCVTKSSYDNFQSEHNATIQFKQRWSSLQVNLKNDSSSSCSNSGAILVERPEGVVITYQYLNEPLPQSVESMQIHYGTARLVVAEDNASMEGSYYSGRGRLNYGTIILRKV